MEMKYYNSSNNFSAPIKREPRPYRPPAREAEETIFSEMHIEEELPAIAEEPDSECEEMTPPCETKQGLSFEKDDYLLMGLILLLLLNGCEDYLLLIVLGYLLIAGRDRKKFI